MCFHKQLAYVNNGHCGDWGKHFTPHSHYVVNVKLAKDILWHIFIFQLLFENSVLWFRWKKKVVKPWHTTNEYAVQIEHTAHEIGRNYRGLNIFDRHIMPAAVKRHRTLKVEMHSPHTTTRGRYIYVKTWPLVDACPLPTQNVTGEVPLQKKKSHISCEVPTARTRQKPKSNRKKKKKPRQCFYI